MDLRSNSDFNPRASNSSFRKSKHYMSYDIMMNKPDHRNRNSKVTNPTHKQKSAREIDEKLVAAAERRTKIAQKKRTSVARKLEKVTVANRRRDEVDSELVAQSLLELEKKKRERKEKREAKLEELRQKLLITLEQRRRAAAEEEEAMCNDREQTTLMRDFENLKLN